MNNTNVNKNHSEMYQFYVNKNKIMRGVINWLDRNVVSLLSDVTDAIRP